MYYPGDKQKQAHEAFYAQALAARHQTFSFCMQRALYRHFPILVKSTIWRLRNFSYFASMSFIALDFVLLFGVYLRKIDSAAFKKDQETPEFYSLKTEIFVLLNF
jgi:hypothetical protein